MMEKKYKIDQVAIRMVKEKSLYSTKPITTPEDAVRILADAVREYDREVFCIVNVNAKNMPININICSLGDLTSSPVSIREVLKTSILSNACNVIVLHNHPSGVPEPSDMDIVVTDKLNQAYSLMDINFLDHIIVGEDTLYSFNSNKELSDSKLDFTSVMNIYQMKHGLEEKRKSIKKQLNELKEEIKKVTDVSKRIKSKEVEV
ncbi:MAG: JAB domain-containing protein [Lachnospiraceae bacterium]|nr:JAB domain-containing protein [Lachnospiraceae bacterium]